MPNENDVQLVKAETLKLGPTYREFSLVENARVSEDKKTLTFSFSSELPVSRWYGDEVLSHDDGAADLARFNGGAQFLFNHDWDRYVGVIEKAWIDNKRGYVEVRFSDNEFAKQVERDIENKILRNVSFGYRILEMVRSKDGEDTKTVYTAKRWEPYEVSIVTVPADPGVGVGRQAPVGDARAAGSREDYQVDVFETRNPEPEAAPADSTERKNDMPPSFQQAQRQDENTGSNQGGAAPAQQVSRDEVLREERQRTSEIQALGDRLLMRELAQKMINDGTPLDQARAMFLQSVGGKQVQLNPAANDLDLSDKDKRSYSVIRAINAAIAKDWRQAGFEHEVSNEIAKRAGKSTQGFFMPLNVTGDKDAAARAERAAYTTGTPTAAGNLVATDLLAGSFIDLLRARALVFQLGARFLRGLQGNVAIPRQNAQTTAYWVTEGVDITENEGMTFGLVTLNPKHIGARSQITRQMLQQSTPDIELLVRQDLATVLALGIDKAAIHGTGSSGQPTGVLAQSGIGSVVGGTNGAAVTIDHLIDMETAVAGANADFGSLAYLTNPKVVGALKKLKSTTGQYLWTNNPGGGRSATPGEINGYPVARTTQVASNLTKGTASGVASAIVFGNWSDLLVGEWGVLEILPNPYGAGYNAGSVDIRALQTVDLAVRHGESFAAMTDALTS